MTNGEKRGGLFAVVEIAWLGVLALLGAWAARYALFVLVEIRRYLKGLT